MNYTFRAVNTKRVIRRPIRHRPQRTARRLHLTAASLFTHIVVIEKGKPRRRELAQPWVPRHLLRHSQADVARALLERKHGAKPLTHSQRSLRYLTQTNRRKMTAKQARRFRQKLNRGL